MNLPAYLAPFRPRILSALRGYTRERLAKDLETGLAAGVVALQPSILLTLPVWRPVLNSMKNWADPQHSGQDHRTGPGGTVPQRRTAVRMPRKISIGAGGHPGTQTSTGITRETGPQLA